MKHTKKILSIAANILVVILILLAVVISLSTFTAKSNNGVPHLFGYMPFSIQTDSMKGTINPGDYIFVEKCDTQSLEVGDIISFFTIIQNERVINTHAIVEVTNENGSLFYTTQGTNTVTNPTPDELPVYPSDVIGKYTGKKIPALGYVFDFLNNKVGFFICIVLPVLLFTVFQVYKLVVLFIHNKKIDILEAAATHTSDEVKQAIIEEYMAKQKQQEEQEKDDGDAE